MAYPSVVVIEQDLNMNREGVEIKWHSIGKACLRLGTAFGASFLVIAFLDKIPGFSLLSQNSPWIPKYIGDSIAFAIGLIIIWRVSQGNFRGYGLTLTGRNLKIKASIAIGILLGLVGILVEHLPQLISGSPLEPAHPYPLSPANILGMLSFQWVFVGIFEETITRGLVQTPLMKELKGTVRIFRWDFHIGSVITAVIFGVGHFGPHIFFGGSWISLPSHLAFAVLYGFGSSYVYQETKSLAGPILMHNIVDGLLYTADLLFY
jgi:membrane protease YdiL (CAAX protease family)